MTNDRVLKPKSDHRPPRTAPSPWAAEPPCLADRYPTDPLMLCRARLEALREIHRATKAELHYLLAERARVEAACDEIAHRAGLADDADGPAASALWAAAGLVRTALGEVSDDE